MSGLLELARALRRGGGDRRRSAWLAAAIAGAGTLGCAAVTLAARPGCGPIDPLTDDSEPCPNPPGVALELAPFLSPDHQVGPVLFTLILVVPLLLLTVQVLRFGTADRERRLAVLAVAGACLAELRRLGALEAARPTAVGAVLAPVGYLLLRAVLWGALLPGRWLLPPDLLPPLIAWPVIALLLIGFAATVGAAAARPASLTPTGPARRVPRRMRPREVFAPVLALATVGVLLSPGMDSLFADTWWITPYLPALMVMVLVVLAVTVGPLIAAVAGRLLVALGGPIQILAGRRLLADPRTPGRVAGVWFGVGFASFVEALMIYLEVTTTTPSIEYRFGLAVTLVGTLFVTVVAWISLLVGAAEQLAASGRPTAALVALGASEADACRRPQPAARRLGGPRSSGMGAAESPSHRRRGLAGAGGGRRDRGAHRSLAAGPGRPGLVGLGRGSSTAGAERGSRD